METNYQTIRNALHILSWDFYFMDQGILVEKKT